MTLKEYLIRMEAVRYRMVDDDFKLAKQAWFNQQVKAQKQQGKKTVSAYKKFNDFFDYEKEVDKLTKEKREMPEKHKMMAQFAMMYNVRQQEKGG